MSETQPSSSSSDLYSESEDIVSIDPNNDNELSSFTEMTCKKIILVLKNKNKQSEDYRGAESSVCATTDREFLFCEKFCTSGTSLIILKRYTSNC